MLRIGLTGGIGSGKSTVASLFKELGTAVIDADDISHQLSNEPQIIASIRSLFGDSVVQPDGGLDRKQLAGIVFSDSHARQQLEALLHPLVRQRMMQAIESIDAPYVILVAPLLLETDFHHLVDRILVVNLPVEEQVRRVKLRDDRPESQIRAIIDQQISRDQRLRMADDIIDNSLPETHLKAVVESLHHRYLRL